MKTLMLTVPLVIALSACSSEAIDTKEACLEAGGHVVSAEGPPASCPTGEEEIGQIPEGVEGAICCK